MNAEELGNTLGPIIFALFLIGLGIYHGFKARKRKREKDVNNN